ncbi:MAG TPA: prolipoprotein diacylglyceryl transferase family protein [Planctomycetota bacterium]|nr:prolipoprotein diacylglyceryl transferase family protein [Planctomycetota bacterium]
MHPILFELPGGFPVRSFGVLLAAGFRLGSWIFSRLVARFSNDPERDLAVYGALPLWILVGIVVGARAFYVVVELAKGGPTGQGYLADPLSMLAVWQGGLVMYGGLIGGLIGGMWCARRQGIPLWHAVDLGLVAGWFGLAVGRVGCLMVGDDYGAVVPARWRDLPFPITLRVPDPLPVHSLWGAANAGEVLWATQPWMTLNAVAIGCLGLWLLGRRRYPGQVSLVIVLVYALTRSTIEAFRGDEVRGTWFDGAISTSQLISIVAGTLALALLWRLRGLRIEFQPGARAA